jgi:hypothetical protein
MLPVLRRGTVLEVCKSFDPVIVQIGDRGIIVKEALPEGAPKPFSYMPGPVLHLYVVKPTHGALPIYNCEIPERVEDGTLRIVEEVTHEISDEEMESIRSRMEEYQAPRADAYFDELDLLFIKIEDLNMRHQADQDELDERILAVLLKKGGMPLREVTVEYTSHHNYRHRYEIVEESAQRLVVSGKILPFEEGKALIPCR